MAKECKQKNHVGLKCKQLNWLITIFSLIILMCHKYELKMRLGSGFYFFLLKKDAHVKNLRKNNEKDA